MKNKYAALIIALIVIIILIFYNVYETRKEEKKYFVLHETFIYDEPLEYFEQVAFEERREEIRDNKGEGVIIVSAAAGDDFLYLTGFIESRGIAVLSGSPDSVYKLFVTPRHPHTTLWTGEVYGTQGAMEKLGADTAYTIGRFEEMLPDLLEGQKRIFVHSGDNRVAGIVERFADQNSEIVDIKPVLHEMRVTKDKWEIDQLRNAVEVTSLAHLRAMKTVAPGQKEYDVQAEIEYVYMKNGLSVGFPSIVGSGPNATILHYRENNRTLEEGDLLLIDIGAASKGGYVADITRTIPVNGKFSPEQRELYELVLKASDEAIKLMAPGNRILDCHHKAAQIITDGLYELGLITDTTQWWQKRFYIHYRSNHYIGLNVHDVGSYGDFDPADRDSYLLNREIRGRSVLPGMVMTIEPGIYLTPGRLDYLQELFGDEVDSHELEAFAEKVAPVYKKYEGTGIRIEDDILVTLDGNEIMSKNAPRTVAEIERIMGR